MMDAHIKGVGIDLFNHTGVQGGIMCDLMCAAKRKSSMWVWWGGVYPKLPQCR